MHTNQALEVLNALSQSTRLDVFRVLVKAGNIGMPAGDISDALAVRQNTLSTHLGILSQADLVTKERNGRVIRYRANYARMQNLLMFLMQDCCQGNANICAPVVDAMNAIDQT